MSQTLSLQQLADKIIYLEQELNTVRQELANLRQQKETVPPAAQPIPAVLWTDKATLKQGMDHLFKRLSIEGKPIGIQKLRQMMSENNLSQNELSQGIIEMREK